MTTTVRIQDTDKVELDKLQALILLKSGKKITHDMLLHYLLKHAKNKVIELIIDDVNDQNIDWDGLLDTIGDFGETDSSNINDIIYGDN
jgi:hypothetical protein